MKTKLLALLALAVLGTACTSIDATDHCVETRYGKVVTPKMDAGLTTTFTTDVTCFPNTQQQFPPSVGKDNEAPAEDISFLTKDSTNVQGEISFEWTYTDAFQAFNEKRRHEVVLAALSNAVRSGARDAGATITLADLFGPKRDQLDQLFQQAIQAQSPKYIKVGKVFVRKLVPPGPVMAAWQAAVAQRAEQQKARDAFVADSLNARRQVLAAETEARRVELENRAMAQSPEVLRLKASLALAEGLKGICGKASTCVVDPDAVSKFFLTQGRQ